MKKTLLAALSATFLLFSGVVSAQEEEAEGPGWIPVETWSCHFNEGKSMADLNGVIDEWNAWLDENDVTDYFASLAIPHYYGERKFDIGWIGGWKDGHAMGAGTDMWVTSGGEMGAKFFEVIDCSSHTNFVSTIIKPPTGEPEEGDNTYVLDFMDCSVNEGQTFESVMAGLGAWAAHQSENGFQNSTYIMFPVFGESNNDYSFKLIESHDSHTTLGADYELMGNGGHWQKQMELLSPLIKCDVPRLYDMRSLRDWSDNETE